MEAFTVAKHVFWFVSFVAKMILENSRSPLHKACFLSLFFFSFYPLRLHVYVYTGRIVSVFSSCLLPFHKRVRLTKFVLLDVALCVYAVDLLVAVWRRQPGIRVAPCEYAICATWCPWSHTRHDVVGVESSDFLSCHTVPFPVCQGCSKQSCHRHACRLLGKVYFT